MNKKIVAMVIWASPNIKMEYLQNKKVLKRLRKRRDELATEMEIELEELNIKEYHKVKEQYYIVANQIQKLAEKEMEYITKAFNEFTKK